MPASKMPPSKTPDSLSQNIESIATFYKREHEKATSPQRLVERIILLAARPSCLVVTLVFVVLWIAANIGAQILNLTQFDPKPFHLLHGVVSVFALLTATVVLIRQERQAKIDELRDHLELQLNLLTEQKTSKLINLIEELRHDLPMVKDRHDGESEALQQATDPLRVLAEIDAIGIAVTPLQATASEILSEKSDSK